MIKTLFWLRDNAIPIATLVLLYINKRAVKEVHLSLNSRFDEWMAATKRAAFAEGVKSETDKKP